MSQKGSEAAHSRSVLNVSWVAHKGASADTGNNAEKLMQQLLPPDAFVMTDRQPDIILFMSGGSERKAITLADPERPVLLLSIRGNNAYASATEVMAWLVNNNRFALLADAMDAFESGLINRWRQTVGVWQSLAGTKAGLLDRAYIAEGKVVSHPALADACRTQVEIELPSQSLGLLRTRPLGNHLLMAPGKHAELLRLACIYRGIEVIE